MIQFVFPIFMLYQSADAGAGTEKPFLDKRLSFAKNQYTDK